MANDAASHSTKRKMPHLFIKDTKLSSKFIQLKSWWRQLKVAKSNKSTSSASSHTTLDWRSLSPDRPPLPFFLPENSPTSSTTSIHNLNDSSPLSNTPNNTSALLTDTTLLEPNEHTRFTTGNSPNSNGNKSVSRTNTENYQPLCPILEESETMVTESSASNVITANSTISPQHSRISPQISDLDNDEHHIISSSDSTSSFHADIATHTNTTSTTNNNDPTTINTNLTTQPSTSTSTSTTDQPPSQTEAWPEIKAVQRTPGDQYMPQDLVGNEERCKRKFAKMVLAANKFQTQQQEQDRPRQMALIFNDQGNIDMMRMVRQDKSEYHKFCGNPQYVPPELSINSEYQSEPADIWVLGIFLYRMLVGKYPFSATNDRQLFKKMLHSDFSIPSDLSEDAKDILRRMLAPDSTRASLDLIIYHPWIKSYRPLLLDHYQSISKNAGNTMMADKPKLINKNNNNNNNNNKRPTISNGQTKRNLFLGGRSLRRTNSVDTETPPSSSNTTTTTTTTTTTSSSSNNEPKPKKPKRNSGHQRHHKGFVKKAFLLLLQGPFPPPKKPYQDLAHLGTRESIFAKYKQPQAARS